MRPIFLTVFLFLTFNAFTQQEVTITIGPEKLQTGDNFSISVLIKNATASNVTGFPEIKGFKKEGKSVAHSNVVLEGKRTLQHTIVQNYTAEKAGTFELPEKSLTVNNEKVELPEKTLTVVNSEVPEEEAFEDHAVVEDALLFLFVNKKEVYVGESFRIHLAFYVSKENTARWEFPKDLTAQVNRISSELKPKNCLENRRIITDIKPEPARINGKEYIRYKFFESVYYPLAYEPIVLPATRLLIDKKSGPGDSTRVDKTSFVSRAFTVNINALPEHPLKNKVSVGHYALQELTKLKDLNTGKITNYTLRLTGEGNANTLVFDKPENDKSFDFYPPNAEVNQNPGSEFGSKTFTFKVFPKDSGQHKMGNYFRWIYFDTHKKNYDTLWAKQTVDVTGPTIITNSSESEGIYAGLEELSTGDKSINYRKLIKNSANILLFLMLVGMLFIFDFKRTKQ